MVKNSKKTYTKDFNKEAVSLAKKQDYSNTEAARSSTFNQSCSA